MAAPASLLADGHEAVPRARYGAAHEQQVPFRIHFHDLEAELREAARPHVPRHPLSFDDSRRVSSGSDRSGLAVARVAVRLGAAPEMVAVHHALEAAALGHAGHLHDVARLEDRHADRLPRLRLRSRSAVRSRRHGEALQHARHDLETRPLHVSEQGLGRSLRLLRAEAELDRGPALPTRDRHVCALLIEEARHAELASDESVHVRRYSTLISTSTPAGKSSFVRASTVCDLESRMSISRLGGFSSDCSRLFLAVCGPRSPGPSWRLVGSGIGPET